MTSDSHGASRPAEPPPAATPTPVPHKGRNAGIFKAAGVMVVAMLASRVLGQLRETAIAIWFGQNGTTDVYRAAFSVPDTLFFLLAGGALSSSFIPVFTEYFRKGKEEEAWHIFSVVATFLFITISILIILGEIFARDLVPVFTPGLKPWQLDATAALTRIVLPAQLCFFLGGLIMATLYVRGKFLVPSLGPIIYNLGIILGGWFLHRRLGLAGLCWGALVGAVVGNFLIQVVYLKRLGVHFRPSLNLRHPGVVRMGKLVLPVLLGLSMPQVFALINKWFASYLADGTISALDNANKLMQAPLGIFAQAIAIAIFPAMSALAVRGEMAEYKRTFLQGLRALWFIMLPLSFAMMILAPDIVSVLFQYKKFTAANTHVTAVALVCYCIGLFAFSSQAILNRAFYAIQDTITPVIIGTVITILFICLNAIMMNRYDYVGLAVAGSLAAILHAVWMVAALRRKVGVPVAGLNLSFLKFIAAGIVSAAVGWLARDGIFNAAHSPAVQAFGIHPKFVSLASIAIVMTLSGAVYLLIAKLMGCEEISFVRRALLRRKKPAIAAAVS